MENKATSVNKTSKPEPGARAKVPSLPQTPAGEPKPSLHASLHIPRADPGWGLVMQSGARIACTVGIPLRRLLHEQFGLSEERIAPITAMLLDGHPVDDPETAIVPDSARIALAAGLPGIAGLALRSGSAVRGLRPGITFSGGGEHRPEPGSVELALFSLALPMLAGHFLARGAELRPGQIIRYARLLTNDTCVFNGTEQPLSDALLALARMPEDGIILFSAALREEYAGKTAR